MRTVSFKDTFEIDIDGSDFNLHYTYDPGERETRMEPGCDPYVTINKVMINLADKNGNMIEVDVSSIIDIDMDYDWMCEQILETLNE